jgi:hypothetical protein
MLTSGDVVRTEEMMWALVGGVVLDILVAALGIICWGYLPAHNTLVGRYGYTIRPKGFRRRFPRRFPCKLLP